MVDLKAVAEEIESHELCTETEPTFHFEDGIVTVEGTKFDDTITAIVDGQGLLVITVANTNGTTIFAVSNSQVTNLAIDSKCGNDTVGIGPNVAQPSPARNRLPTGAVTTSWPCHVTICTSTR